MEATISRAAAHLDHVVGHARRFLREVQPTLPEEVAAMEQLAYRADDGLALGALLAEARDATRWLTLLDDALTELRGHAPPPATGAPRGAMTVEELRVLRADAAEADLVRTALDANADVPPLLRAAVERRVTAIGIVSRRVRVRLATARVAVLRAELEHLRTFGNDSADLSACIARVESAVGHALPLPAIRWDADPPLAVPQLDEAPSG